jgi:hypothetical protein
VLADPAAPRTPDMGGAATTREFTDALISHVRKPSRLPHTSRRPPARPG